MTDDPIETLAKEILGKIQPPMAAPSPDVNPSDATVAFAKAAARFMLDDAQGLVDVDEAVRRAVASMLHPEGTAERRGISRHPLTGLPDKASYLELLPTFETNKLYAIISIDANGLKLINKELGHHFGDAILIAVARTLTVVAKQFGEANVFHLSGDEFAAFVPMDSAQKFIDTEIALLNGYFAQEQIENGRSDAQSRNGVVATAKIRGVLGRKSGITAGYGPNEEAAERMLRLNKALHYSTVPLVKGLVQRLRNRMQNQSNSGP